jgi:hypothetical protein
MLGAVPLVSDEARYVILLTTGTWAVQTREKADELSRRTQELQIQLVERISRLQQEATNREG